MRVGVCLMDCLLVKRGSEDAVAVVTNPDSGRSPRAWRRLPFFATLCLLAVLVACGGSPNPFSPPPTPAPPTPTPAPAPPPPPSPPPNTLTQIKVGDSPVDSVISFSVGIGSPIVLTPANGGAAVNLAVPTPNRVELSHLAAKVEPLAIVNVPQGNYSTLTITMLAPTVQI